jgi:TadE-like protein
MNLPSGDGRDARTDARPGRGGAARTERGQATVEFALVLPLVFGLLLLLVQIGLVGRDELLVVHAARDAVREATLTANAADVARAAQRTLPGSTAHIVRRGSIGEAVEVQVTYVSRTNLPLIGALLPDITVHGASVMRVERA